jgi:hypothetical protein
MMALVAVVAAVFVLSWREIGMEVLPMFTGVGHTVSFLAQRVPPQFLDFGYTVRTALVTVCMAVVGTTFAILLADRVRRRPLAAVEHDRRRHAAAAVRDAAGDRVGQRVTPAPVTAAPRRRRRRARRRARCGAPCR